MSFSGKLQRIEKCFFECRNSSIPKNPGPGSESRESKKISRSLQRKLPVREGVFTRDKTLRKKI
ncbi:hypothetical protein CH375_11495 [Leptospira ellisii]|uniref:Uncharacterized protein n=1 Tax=Leptospira ellisii TaxID=2023197 RepID=A0A2N0BKF2_9LEPT|nr:hypothetical protein CH379_03785 [Leptospira ellisii]PKA04348.1 hypothetical protein CH375_11495 [Leptospira ellisii]